MKILLTGSEGFIANRIYNGISNLIDNYEDIYSYDLVNGDDIRDKYHLEYLFETEHFDTVIHCAALAGVRRSELYPEDYISTNIIGTKNLIDLSEKYGVTHFINFSSSSVYGADTKDGLKEDAVKNPKSIYSMTKLIAEQIAERSSIKTTTIRPFTVYGENGRGDLVIKKWCNQIKAGKPITFYGDGHTGRGYTYLGDLVDGVMKVLEHSKGGTYNLGGSQFVTLDGLLMIFNEVYGQLHANILDIPKGDNQFNFADTSKAFKDLGWKPTTDFKKQLTKILKDEKN